jgi:NADH-quinone oxidoreductase subunit L
MLAGLGAGSFVGGYFHLGTHASFKALLFLAAGSLIHAVGSNELARMRGVGRRLPLTGAVVAIGALALAGLPGLSGFFSKETILEGVTGLPVVLVLLLAAGFVTALYVGRVLVLLFAPGRTEPAHECGPTMAVPLVALAIPALAAGFLGGPFASLLGRPYAFHVGAAGATATVLALAGLAAGVLVYRRGDRVSARLAALRPFDRMYELAYARVLVLVSAVAAWVDRYLVDGLMNGVGALFLGAGQRLRRLETGDVKDYVLAVAAGAAILVIWGISR